MALASLRWRPRLVAKLGEAGFAGVYSLVALAIFVPLVWIYFANKHAGPHLWYVGGLPGMRWLVYIGMGVALSLVVCGIVRPSPAIAVAGRPLTKSAEATGIFRIARHPTFTGAGLFGAVHLLAASINAAELAFFAGIPIFGWLGCRHQDRRKFATSPEIYGPFCEGSPFVPFSGPDRLRGLREAWIPIAIGVALTVLLRTYHAQLFL